MGYVTEVTTPWDALPVPCNCRQALRRRKGVKLVCLIKQASVTLARQTLPRLRENKVGDRQRRLMQRALVVSSNRKQIMPCHSARARMLLRHGKAAVLIRYPFTIILKDRTGGECQPIELKADPGSKETGIALVADYKRGKTVVWAGEIKHRGWQIKNALGSRKAIRRSRRNRKTRYRQPRFDNRIRPNNWLPPSVMSRVHNVDTWAGRLQRLAPVTSIAVETVRFDTQKLVNPEISGVEYQNGTLYGYEVKEYLLEKWGRQCAYCGAKDTPLQLEHITPKSRGGTDRVTNLTLSCEKCNRKKNTLTAKEFGYPDIQKQTLKPLKDAAAVNAARYAIGNALKKHGLPVTFWTGGRTKYNSTMQNYPKTHWIDAACVGQSGENIKLNPAMRFLTITAKGHGSRQACRVNQFGFPRTSAKRMRLVHGFKTGDIAQAVVQHGKKKGIHTGRIAVRSSGSFNIQTSNGTVQGVSHRNCSVLHQSDGYTYN